MIAGIGFAMMAWKLAWYRVWRSEYPLGSPCERGKASTQPKLFPASVEYYRIIDKAWAHFDTMRQCNALFGETVHL
jgi:hypothetical protein